IPAHAPDAGLVQDTVKTRLFADVGLITEPRRAPLRGAMLAKAWPRVSGCRPARIVGPAAPSAFQRDTPHSGRHGKRLGPEPKQGPLGRPPVPDAGKLRRRDERSLPRSCPSD